VLAERALALGWSFERFWSEAVRPDRPLVMTTSKHPPEGAIRWPTDRNDRLTWRGAICGSKEGWRRAYEGEAPTEQEAALAMLAPGLDALDVVARERAAGELAEGIEAQDALPSAA
jgi:hypothetical protein